MFMSDNENEFLTGTMEVLSITTDTEPTSNVFVELLEA